MASSFEKDASCIFITDVTRIHYESGGFPFLCASCCVSTCSRCKIDVPQQVVIGHEHVHVILFANTPISTNKANINCLYHSCNVFALIERPWGISLTLISLFYFLLCLVEPLCDWKCFVFTKDQKFAHTDLFIWMGECVPCFVGCWSTDDQHKKQFRKKFVPQFYLNTPNQFRIRPQTRTHSSFLKVISFPLFLSLTWWPLLWVSAHVPLF